jgi:hypothetical protein
MRPLRQWHNTGNKSSEMNLTETGAFALYVYSWRNPGESPGWRAQVGGERISGVFQTRDEAKRAAEDAALVVLESAAAHLRAMVAAREAE